MEQTPPPQKKPSVLLEENLLKIAEELQPWIFSWNGLHIYELDC